MQRFTSAFLVAATISIGGCAVVPAEPVAVPPPVAAPVPATSAPAPASGAVIGIATTGTDRWYKDQYGRCYRVDDRGDRVYDNARQC